MSDRQVTEDGHELVIQANHLSHFLLTILLFPEINKTHGRIVNLSSALHKTAKSYDYNDVMSLKTFSLFHTYAQSKLANCLFTLELQKRLVS